MTSAAPSEVTPFRYRGWPLVTGLSVAQLISWGSIFYGFTVFLAPMEQELGWSRANLNFALTLGLLARGFGSFPVGWVIDRYGGRWIMSAGSLMASVLFVMWARVETEFEFYLLWIGLGFTQAATLYEPVFAVVTRLFPVSYRQRILVITLAGGFASTVFVPFTAWAVAAFGWRDALLLLAGWNFLVCLPVHLFWLRDRANPHRAESEVGSENPVRDALRHPVFWALALCFVCHAAAMSMLIFHLIPMLTEWGWTLPLVVAVYSVIGPAQVAGRVALMAVASRMDARSAGRIVTVMFSVAIAMLMLQPEAAVMLFVAMGTYGAANGIMTIVRGTAVPELLWREGYGAVNGLIGLPASVAQALAPTAAALIWQATGGYMAVLWLILALSAAMAASFWFAAARAPQSA